MGEQAKLSSVFTFGIGRNFQAGINVRDLTIDYRAGQGLFPYKAVDPEQNPDVLANLQTGVSLGNNYHVGIGTQSGANIAGEGVDSSTFNYLNLQGNFEQSKLLIGSYYGNDTFVARGNNVGFMAGIELPLIGDNIKLLGDYLSGNNARSIINVGLGVKLEQKWNLSFG